MMLILGNTAPASSPSPKHSNKAVKLERLTPSDVSHSPTSYEGTLTQPSFVSTPSPPQIVPIPSPGLIDGTVHNTPPTDYNTSTAQPAGLLSSTTSILQTPTSDDDDDI